MGQRASTATVKFPVLGKPPHAGITMESVSVNVPLVCAERLIAISALEADGLDSLWCLYDYGQSSLGFISQLIDFAVVIFHRQG